MKGDFSRETFQAELHYSTVRMQQGRVQLDADLNEQADIARYRAGRDSADAIGRCGAPLDAAAFGIVTELASLSAAETAALQARFGPGFSLAAGDFMLTPGHYWVDGILCESEYHVPYSRQLDLPGVGVLDPARKGHHIVYLDVWQRHVTALEAPLLRETALGGPDTATRTRVVWQVRTVFAGEGVVHCQSEPAAYKKAVAPSTGTMRARAVPEAAADQPCIVPATAEFRGLENQLYRVEIHNPGDPYDLTTAPEDVAITDFPAANQVVFASGNWAEGQAVEVFLSGDGADPMAGWVAHVTEVEAGTKQLTLSSPLPTIALADLPRLRLVEATLKWSRDNGSVASLVSVVSGRDVTVHSLGPDEVLGFRLGDWVEIVDRARELDGLPGHLGRVKEILPGGILRLHEPAEPFPGDLAAVDPERGMIVRRWDGIAAVKVSAPALSDGYAELEDGVEVRFEPGMYATGDHWTIPARTATAEAHSGKIEWPEDEAGDPAARRPAGIEHHVCRLAVLSWDGAKVALVEDCRGLFPPLTELATLVPVGGDGQETRPGQAIPQPLEAGVFRGRWPVGGVKVRFKASDGGKLAGNVAGLTGAGDAFEESTAATGLVACRWLPNPAGPHSQHVTVRALDSSGAALPPVVRYSGSLSTADEVAYTAEATCTYLAATTTVKEALDLLCKRPTGGSCAVRVTPEDDLVKVIADLFAAGSRAICICLTAGDHALTGPLVLDDAEMTLKIGGCGRGSRLSVDAAIKLARLSAVELRDLDLLVRTDEGLVLVGCRDVTLASCHIFREAPGAALVTIAVASRIRIDACVIDAAVGRQAREPVERLRELLAVLDRGTLSVILLKVAEELAGDEDLRKVLADEIDAAADELAQFTATEQAAHAALGTTLRATGDIGRLLEALARVHAAAGHGVPTTALVLMDAQAGTHVADSEMVGALSMYGQWDPKQVFGGGDPPRWGAMLRDDSLRLLSSDATLHVRDSRFTRMTVGGSVARRLLDSETANLEVFRAALLCDNVVVGDRSLLLAGHLAMTGSEFEDPAEVVALTIDDSAIYTSNHGHGRPSQLVSVALERAAAANLELAIVPHP